MWILNCKRNLVVLCDNRLLCKIMKTIKGIQKLLKLKLNEENYFDVVVVPSKFRIQNREIYFSIYLKSSIKPLFNSAFWQFFFYPLL
jgi:hypothetical protein